MNRQQPSKMDHSILDFVQLQDSKERALFFFLFFLINVIFKNALQLERISSRVKRLQLTA